MNYKIPVISNRDVCLYEASSPVRHPSRPFAPSNRPRLLSASRGTQCGYTASLMRMSLSLTLTCLQGLAWDSASSTHFSMFATSVEHPECPKRRGWVRALLRVSTTMFEKAGDDGAGSSPREAPVHGAALLRLPAPLDADTRLPIWRCREQHEGHLHPAQRPTRAGTSILHHKSCRISTHQQPPPREDTGLTPAALLLYCAGATECGEPDDRSREASAEGDAPRDGGEAREQMRVVGVVVAVVSTRSRRAARCRHHRNWTIIVA